VERECSVATIVGRLTPTREPAAPTLPGLAQHSAN